MAGKVLSDRDVERIHNDLVKRWQTAGFTPETFREPQNRGVFIANLAREIEAAVIERVAPELLGGSN
ncbi:hypothetical protein [Hyphomicrobium sp. DY-1]|uniref:hypothetical protein n=1 Tax=Hyphomicrobium sp. DY-1 TaxID=3075650 RepID=UPI0039C0CD19